MDIGIFPLCRRGELSTTNFRGSKRSHSEEKCGKGKRVIRGVRPTSEQVYGELNAKEDVGLKAPVLGQKKDPELLPN